MRFGGFTFASEVRLGRIAGFYGLSVPEAERETSVAEFVRARLPHTPTLGDRIRFERIELVVREMSGDRIATVELELEPGRRGSDFMSGNSPARVPGM